MDVRAVAQYAAGRERADLHREVILCGSVVSYRWLRRHGIIGRKLIESVFRVDPMARKRAFQIHDRLHARGESSMQIMNALTAVGLDLGSLAEPDPPLRALCEWRHARLAQEMRPAIKVTTDDIAWGVRKACRGDDVHMLRVLRITYGASADAIIGGVVAPFRAYLVHGVTNAVFRELVKLDFAPRHVTELLALMMPRAPRSQFQMLKRTMNVPRAALLPYLNDKTDSWRRARAAMLHEVFGD